MVGGVFQNGVTTTWSDKFSQWRSWKDTAMLQGCIRGIFNMKIIYPKTLFFRTEKRCLSGSGPFWTWRFDDIFFLAHLLPQTWMWRAVTTGIFNWRLSKLGKKKQIPLSETLWASSHLKTPWLVASEISQKKWGQVGPVTGCSAISDLKQICENRTIQPTEGTFVAKELPIFSDPMLFLNDVL